MFNIKESTRKGIFFKIRKKMNNMNSRIYYQDSSKFNRDDWYFCLRYLNRLFQLKDEESANEIMDLDFNKINDDIKTLMYGILEAQKSDLYDFSPNLLKLKEYNKPLKEKLIISEKPSNLFKELEKLNIYW